MEENYLCRKTLGHCHSYLNCFSTIQMMFLDSSTNWKITTKTILPEDRLGEGGIQSGKNLLLVFLVEEAKHKVNEKGSS